MIRLLRWTVAVVLGLVTVSVVVEPLEWLLVTLVGGGIVSDAGEYFGIRNRPPFLAVKMVYNLAGGFVGGWVAARVGGGGAASRPLGWTLAAVQTGTILWAMQDPELGLTAPAWAWMAFAVVTAAGIVAGAERVARVGRSSDARESAMAVAHPDAGKRTSTSTSAPSATSRRTS